MSLAWKRIKSKKKDRCGIIDAATDCVRQMDLRKQQTHFPPHIITTAERPDIVMYSDQAKVVVLVELTSPAEENLVKWREVKLTKYEKLAENRGGGMWKVFVFTIEVGARGFVAKRAGYVWRRLGLTEKEGQALSQKISRNCH